MAKSAKQFRQSTTKQVDNQPFLGTNFIATSNNANSVNELEKVAAEVQELEKKNDTLSKEKLSLEKKYTNLKAAFASTDEDCTKLKGENANLKANLASAEEENANLKTALTNKHEEYATLNGECSKLKVGYTTLDEENANLKANLASAAEENANLKTTLVSAEEKLENKTITTDEANEPISINSEKNAYDMLSLTIEKIQSEYFFSNNTGTEVKKDTATSINHRESNTKCFEISGSSLKSLESESSDCEKIYSLRNFLDSVGMDKGDASVIANFSNLIKQYSYADKDGKKVIKYTDGKGQGDQECFKMENEKISTYGENSFSDECAPLINLYTLLQTANGKEIWHYENYDLKNYDDTQFNEILGFEFADNSNSATI
ncbi:hypothetical protein [Candidatus Bandiella numerosa]|uniref:hypothetical protein n=1 Tax=Candidatus Bandiella numerosa TaxID=2570586 RepID=UPI001F2E23FE|nr:hypothetical protein [Candidatus Bandiella numerosa]